MNTIQEYGAFIQLEESFPDGSRVRGKKEGMCHLSQMRSGGKLISVGQVPCRDALAPTKAGLKRAD